MIRVLRTWTVIVSVVACSLLLGSETVFAQGSGTPPPVGAKGICVTASCNLPLGYSIAVIDASAFSSQTGTLCGQVNAAQSWINTQTTRLGLDYFATVDARGITNLTCAQGETPFDNVPPNNPPTSYPFSGMTLLLPAGVIQTTVPWKLPNFVEIVGAGTGDVTAAGNETIIRAASNFSGQNVLQVDSTSALPCCHYIFSVDIILENLVIDGNGKNINGISNSLLGHGFRANHVGLVNLGNTGLYLSNAGFSGPYDNITFSEGTANSSATTCIQVIGAGSYATEGFHHVKCTANSNTPAAGIKIDATDNTLEDVVISGFQDGVLIGSEGAAVGNHIEHVIDTSASSVYNSTIHLSTNFLDSDTSIVGVYNECVTGGGINCKLVTIQDDVTGTNVVDTTVAQYFVGNHNLTTVGYPRFAATTSLSPSVPTWLSGAVAPAGTCPQIGTLFSNSGSGGALWVCANTSSGAKWTLIWTLIQ